MFCFIWMTDPHTHFDSALFCTQYLLTSACKGACSAVCCWSPMAAKALIGLYAACRIALVGWADSMISLIKIHSKNIRSKNCSAFAHTKENMLEYIAQHLHTWKTWLGNTLRTLHTHHALARTSQTCSTPRICTYICMHLCTDSSACADLALPNQEAWGQKYTHTHGKTCGMDVCASHTCSNTDTLNHACRQDLVMHGSFTRTSRHQWYISTRATHTHTHMYITIKITRFCARCK